MARVMVDTSAVYALLDRSDGRHVQAVETLTELQHNNASVVITNFIMAETHALLMHRLGPEIARAWLDKQCWPVERITPADEERAKEIIRSYYDKTFTFCDATTFAVMERLGIERAFAFDRHFPQFGVKLCCTL